MKRNLFGVLLPALLAGCISNTRPCPAFDSAFAEQWGNGIDIGDTVTYANASDESISLRLVSRDDNEAYTGISRHSVDVVVCHMRSDRRYVFVDTDIALYVTFRLLFADGTSTSGAPTSMSVSVGVEAPPTNSLKFGFSFSVKDNPEPYPIEFGEPVDTPGRPSSTRQLTNLSLNSQVYPTAIDQRIDRISLIPTEVDPSAAIKRAMFAQGGGLVQFELLNGDVFTRVSEEE